MRIEMKREAELQKRKGQTWRTIFAVIWLAITFYGAYQLAKWLFEEGHLSTANLYQTLRIPSNISESRVYLGTAFVIFVIFQFLVLIFYSVFSSTARRKSGLPRADTDDPDPYEKSSYHQQ